MNRISKTTTAILLIIMMAGIAEPSTQATRYSYNMWKGIVAEPSTQATRYPQNLWKGLIAEAVGEGHRGMYAVACVVRNRLKKGMNTGLAGLKRHDLNAFVARQGEQAEGDAKNIVVEVFERGCPDITNGAIYFESTDFKKPWWAPRKHETIRIGKHIFYK